MKENESIKIDLNTADLSTLQQLPGVGPKLAQLIQEKRPYTTAEDLQKVSGIGMVAIERWKDLLIFPASGEPISEGEPAQAAANLAEDTTPATVENQIQAEDAVPLVADSQIQAVEEAPASVESQEEAEKTEPTASESQPLEQVEAVLEPETEPAMQAQEEPAGETDFPAASAELPAPQEAAPAPALPAGWISRSQAVWGMVITGFAAIILAVAVSLGILAGMNGGLLQFASPSQVAALTTQAKGLETRLNALEQDTQGLRARLDNLEGLGSRVSVVENTTTDLQDRMKSAASQIDTIKEEMGSMQTQIDAVTKLGEQFNKFLQSLQSLLNDMLPLSGGNK